MALVHKLACYQHAAKAASMAACGHTRLQGSSALQPAAHFIRKRLLRPDWRQALGHHHQRSLQHGCNSTSCTAAAAAVVGPDTIKDSADQPLHNIVKILRDRGLLQEVSSPDLEKLASQEKFPVYCGFDPTADSLHLGNLLGIVVLRWFAVCGHTPVALLGGATGRVGDPSGKSAERPILSESNIEHNVQSIKALLQRLLSQGGTQHISQPVLLNNLDWFGAMPLLTFLRQVGKFARVGSMLAKDSVRSRMESESGISYTEFTYQLLQGYDFVHLQREHGCRVQIGGSDQWGNITAGTDLIRRLGSEDGREPLQCFGLTFPLLTSSDGKKWGKSEGGALWLSAEKMSPFKLYQYLLNNTTDQDVIRYLKMLTFLPLDTIQTLQDNMQQPSYKPNTAQRLLAEEVIQFVHGEQGLAAALSATQALQPGAATALDAATLEAIAGDVPSASLEAGQVVGQPLIQVMVAAGLQPSKAASKRMIKGGGVQLNNARITSEDHEVHRDDLIDGRLLLLAAGKKNKLLLRIK